MGERNKLTSFQTAKAAPLIGSKASNGSFRSASKVWNSFRFFLFEWWPGINAWPRFSARCATTNGLGKMRSLRMPYHLNGKGETCFSFRFRLMFTVLASSSVKCLQGNFQFLKNVKNTSPLSQTGKAGNFVIWCCDVLTSSTLLVLILTNNTRRIFSSGVVDADISDHSLIYTVLRTTAPRLRSRKIQLRILKNFVQDLFLRDLHNVPFHVMEVFDDIDDKQYVFESLYLDILNEHVPEK